MTPKGAPVRPTSARVREALIQILESELEASVFIDLFAGTGAVGLEALSRGAKGAVFVEKHDATRRMLQANLNHALARFTAQAIEAPICKVLNLDVQADRALIPRWVKMAQGIGAENTLLFVDPPYAEAREVVEKLCKRFSFQGKDGTLILELPKEEAKAIVDSICQKFPQWRVDKLREYGQAHVVFLKEEVDAVPDRQ
jgi:16S rRNA (guanine(966)-N(2))-methyltransferase RsmD